MRFDGETGVKDGEVGNKNRQFVQFVKDLNPRNVKDYGDRSYKGGGKVSIHGIPNKGVKKTQREV